MASQWVLSFYKYGKSLLYFQCSYSTAGAVEKCKLNRRRWRGHSAKSDGPETIWSSDSYLPTTSHITEEGWFVFDVYGDESRKIIAIELTKEDAKVETVWSGDLWWKTKK